MAREDRQAAPEKPRPWWCNFCGYRTDSQDEYLAHSCQEELRKSGRQPEKTPGRDHCG